MLLPKKKSGAPGQPSTSCPYNAKQVNDQLHFRKRVDAMRQQYHLTDKDIQDTMNSSESENPLDIPQRKTMQALTGKEQKPSDWARSKGILNYEAPGLLGVANRVVGTVDDMVFDPMNLLFGVKGPNKSAMLKEHQWEGVLRKARRIEKFNGMVNRLGKASLLSNAGSAAGELYDKAKALFRKRGGLLPGKLTMLGPDGKAQMELGGGNRIFWTDTRELVSRGLKAKTPAELRELGGRIRKMLG